MKLLIKKGTTSKRIAVFAAKASDGSGLTGLTSATSGLTCAYIRESQGNVGATAISLSAGTRGTWSSGGFVEKDSTNDPGKYELGIPDAVLATGSMWAQIVLFGAADMLPVQVEIQLTGFDVDDTAPDVNVTEWKGSAAADQASVSDVWSNATRTLTEGAAIPAGGITDDSFATGAIAAASLASDALTAFATAIATAVLATPAYKLATDSSGRVTASGFPMTFKKNTALSNIPFVIHQTANPSLPLTTGAAITATRVLDNGSEQNCGNGVTLTTPTYITKGLYRINLTAEDTNCDAGTIILTPATGGLTHYIHFITHE